eukprot:12775909-Ditylum_brightwellii.AAC.1
MYVQQESCKSKTLGLDPTQRQLKVESGDVRYVTGVCGGGQHWMLMALCKRGENLSYQSHGGLGDSDRQTHKVQRL